MPATAQFEVEVVYALPADAGWRTSRTPPPETAPIRVVALNGQTLLRALQRAGAPILSVCGGQASCGACRVEIETASLAGLPPVGRVERDLLEFLDDPAPGHRLACQLVLTPNLDGLRLTLAP